jgi:hypothetical protein
MTRAEATAGAARVLLLAAAMSSMAYGVWLGLLRLGWALPLPRPEQLILHGPLMIGGFLGTLMGLERAVDTAKRSAYVAPACSAAGAFVLVFGPPSLIGPLLITLASVVAIAVLAAVLRRQASLCATTILAGAVCWFIGNTQWTITAASIYRVVFWWVGFVVLTIAGERLELNRVRRPTYHAGVLFAGAAVAVIGGVIAIGSGSRLGPLVAGLGLIAIAAWLLVNDDAREATREKRLTRYTALCLLVGYVWLGAAGVLLIVTRAVAPGTSYDAVLHSVFVGFVVSMIFGHAPIVFPAVLGLPMPYTPAAYVPLVVLHLSVAIRVVSDLFEDVARLRAYGALGNAIAILLFVAITVWSVAQAPAHLRSDRRDRGRGTPSRTPGPLV